MSALPVYIDRGMAQEDIARENFIVACGRRFLDCFDKGDIEGARIWLAAMAKEVLSRSANAVAHLEAERGLV